MPATTKQRFHTIFNEDATDDNDKIELFAPGHNQHENEITAFDTISPSNVVPLRKLKQWPRAVVCPACRELSLTRVERKICGGTHSGTEIHVW
ncbi:hypothetical protein FSARC_2929 [Fusarium sarcochroum]|uniref:Transposase n=1 Tax=Fusarium sarcochroum TaxID=1208366 RepID=A0A8H4U546_9HYPO|nr:hypothetical protein FSARC_2929 [Fusarium sarcochroum]